MYAFLKEKYPQNNFYGCKIRICCITPFWEQWCPTMGYSVPKVRLHVNLNIF